MSKWFERVGLTGGDNYISSRIRLVRNWAEYAFPASLDTLRASELVGRMTYQLNDVGSFLRTPMQYRSLDQLSEQEKNALRERRILNKQTAAKKSPSALYLSEEEDVSILLNGEDHIKMQILAPGLDLDAAWERADHLDDFINSRFDYAFDEKYGYLTAYPSNVGTGMRANVVLHLPVLSEQKHFNALIEGMSRLGVTIRGVYGKGRENYGALYDISNTATLGRSESELISSVKRVASQLNAQELQARTARRSERLSREDEAFKSYGVLRYARKLAVKDAMIYLSQLMTGLADGMMDIEGKCSIYSLMLGIQPYNLMQMADRPMGDEELEVLRAEYIRNRLPEIKEVH